MNIRERSAEIGRKLADKQMELAWPGADLEDMPLVISDAVANLLVAASEQFGENIEAIIDRARMHAEAEIGSEGDEIV